jgi:hypothetical protein
MRVKEILHQLGLGCFGLSSFRKYSFGSYGYFIDSYDSGKSNNPSFQSIKSPQSCSKIKSTFPDFAEKVLI